MANIRAAVERGTQMAVEGIAGNTEAFKLTSGLWSLQFAARGVLRLADGEWQTASVAGSRVEDLSVIVQRPSKWYDPEVVSGYLGLQYGFEGSIRIGFGTDRGGRQNYVEGSEELQVLMALQRGKLGGLMLGGVLARRALYPDAAPTQVQVLRYGHIPPAHANGYFGDHHAYVPGLQIAPQGSDESITTTELPFDMLRSGLQAASRIAAQPDVLVHVGARAS